MKKNLIKKIMASTLTVFAVTAMAVPSMSVFAAETPTINVSPANKLTTATDTVGIPLKKDIVLFNVDQSQILSPNVTYSYEVTSANVTTATITTISSEDAANNVENPTPIILTVNAGPIEAVTTSAGDNNTTDAIKEGTITFGADNTTKYATNDEGADPVDLNKKVSSSLTITIDANKIYDPLYNTSEHTNAQQNGPGVYRYKIKDTTADNTLTAAGIDRKYSNSDTDKVIFLDVYTKYNDQRDGLVVYGYVFLKNTTNAANESVFYDNNETTEALKITGFDTESENTNNYGDTTVASANLKSDSYHTYNVEVRKVTAGALADDQHDFPFKVELSNDTIKSSDDFYYQITKDNNPQNAQNVSLNNAGAWSLDGITNNNTLALHNGDKIVITGLPVGTKIKVTEKNDTNDTYTVSAKGNGSDLTLKKNDTTTTGTSLSIANNDTAELNALANVNKTTGKDEIVFTNTLKDISVTGLLFNIAPFVFITIAGAALLVLFMRNRKSSDNKSKI